MADVDRWADLREWAEYEVGLAETRGLEQREDAWATAQLLAEHDRLRGALQHIADGNIAPSSHFARLVLAGKSIEDAHAEAVERIRRG